MQTGVMRPGEVRRPEFDFSDSPEIVAGQNLSSIVSITADVPGLTIEDAAIVGDSVFAVVYGGLSGEEYRLTCLAQTDAATDPATRIACVAKLKWSRYGYS